MKRQWWLLIPLTLLATIVAVFVAAAGDVQHIHADDPGITAPVVVHRVAPTYPADAKDAMIQGTVVLRVVIEEDGSVGDVKVLEDADASLSRAAVDAVKQWRYEPAHLEDGTVVAVFMEITIRFALDA